MRAAYRRGRDRRPREAREQDGPLQGAGEGVRRSRQGPARHPREERVRPDLHGTGRLGHERLHVRGHDRLLRQRADQQAGAVDVDGVGPAPAPGLPRVLRRARRGLRGAPPQRDSTPPGSSRRTSTRCSGKLALRVARHRLAVGHPGHHEAAGRRLLRHLLRAEQHHGHPRRRLRPDGGGGPGGEVLRPDPAREESAAGGHHARRRSGMPRSASRARPRRTRRSRSSGTPFPSSTGTPTRSRSSPAS